ncbi:MAG TPA: hypothetical protein VJ770_30040 [Stellaceae bacterium]|nr:hypothetical protein [Stellaceae bacterium]
MIERVQDKAKPARIGNPEGPIENLPYRIELWDATGGTAVERVLARAFNAPLARAIFKAAQSEHPNRRVTLRRGVRLIADSAK